MQGLLSRDSGSKKMRGPLINGVRLFARLIPSGACLLWPGRRDKNGYGRLKRSGAHVRAHRVAWEIANGDIPAGMCVLHRCDVPACCNVEHLFVGSVGDNNRDAKAKGRSRGARGVSNGAWTHPERRPRGERNGSTLHPERYPRGERSHLAKLSDAQIVAIRAELACGVPATTLASIYHVSRTHIWRIGRGLTRRECNESMHKEPREASR